MDDQQTVAGHDTETPQQKQELKEAI